MEAALPTALASGTLPALARKDGRSVACEVLSVENALASGTLSALARKVRGACTREDGLFDRTALASIQVRGACTREDGLFDRTALARIQEAMEEALGSYSEAVRAVLDVMETMEEALGSYADAVRAVLDVMVGPAEGEEAMEEGGGAGGADVQEGVDAASVVLAMVAQTCMRQFVQDDHVLAALSLLRRALTPAEAPAGKEGKGKTPKRRKPTQGKMSRQNSGAAPSSQSPLMRQNSGTSQTS
ncbi:hypothetical protein T484DRAFT_1841461 [Baffinella frigidus]|nr:hypothetical protein T484DRAFT_1841461 [Cryptophyta sp. CCMP2293]